MTCTSRGSFLESRSSVWIGCLSVGIFQDRILPHREGIKQRRIEFKTSNHRSFLVCIDSPIVQLFVAREEIASESQQCSTI